VIDQPVIDLGYLIFVLRDARDVEAEIIDAASN
jgi:hypothetical protein